MEGRKPRLPDEDDVWLELFEPAATPPEQTSVQSEGADVSADDDYVPLEIFGPGATLPAPTQESLDPPVIPNLAADDDWVPLEMFAPISTEEALETSASPAPAVELNTAEAELPASPPSIAAAPVNPRSDDVEVKPQQTMWPVVARTPQPPRVSEPSIPAASNEPPPVVQAPRAAERSVAPALSESPSVVPASPPVPPSRPIIRPKPFPIAPPIPPLRFNVQRSVPAAPPAPEAPVAAARTSPPVAPELPVVAVKPPPEPVRTVRPARAPESNAIPAPAVAPSLPPAERSRAIATPSHAAPVRREAPIPMETPRLGDSPRPPEAPVITPPEQPVVPAATKPPLRHDRPQTRAEHARARMEKLLRLAAARHASTLYVSSNARPSVRVDGEVQLLDGTPLLDATQVESLVVALMPARHPEMLPPFVATEWSVDVADVGRVRCASFLDRRGPGAVYRIMPRRGVRAEQLGLSLEIQSLAVERQGLVLIAGPRSSGKRALIGGLVDLINQTRHDHVIVVDREEHLVPEGQSSFISQREAPGGLAEMLVAARAALREDPDVLVLQEVRSAPLMNLAFDAAASGQLVIAGFTAPNASGAIERIIELYPPEHGRHALLSLAQHLRGIIGQVLLPKVGGGQVAAREVVLNTPVMASALAEAKTWQLPAAIEAGRSHGMVPLNDALAALVVSGAVVPAEAYRRAPDPSGFLEALKRQGIDTSFAQSLP